MLCSKCHKREATVYFKQSINGEVREYALCNACAAEQEFGFSSINIFGSTFAPTVSKEELKRCTLCNSTFSEIKNSGKVGCAECYTVFADELEPMIRSIHRGAVHQARTSETCGEMNDEVELDRLKKELRIAIDSENYERAAQLRDMIRQMEANNG